jgi:hypothetical protein
VIGGLDEMMNQFPNIGFKVIAVANERKMG